MLVPLFRGSSTSCSNSSNSIISRSRSDSTRIFSEESLKSKRSLHIRELLPPLPQQPAPWKPWAKRAAPAAVAPSSCPFSHHWTQCS